MATPTTLPATFVAGNVLTAAQMNDLRGAFRILQVVNTIKTDTFTSGTVNQGAEADITGLSATITPRETNSKILVIANVNGSSLQTGATNCPAFSHRIYRGATLIGQGDAAGNRSRVTNQSGPTSAVSGMSTVTSVILDSPATTSATTYKVTFVNANFVNTTAVFYLNFSNASDVDANYTPRTSSSITLLEVSA